MLASRYACREIDPSGDFDVLPDAAAANTGENHITGDESHDFDVLPDAAAALLDAHLTELTPAQAAPRQSSAFLASARNRIVSP